MRAAAIFGLGCSLKNLKPFQTDQTIEWRMGMPSKADQAHVILLFGGDGTIHRHLGQLVRLGLPVLVVPVGSGNDFARALGLRGVPDSLAVWRTFCSSSDNVRSIDLGVISVVGKDADGATLADAQGRSAPNESTRNSVLGTQHYFCSVAGIGLDAEVTRRANALPRWLRGHGGYAVTLLPTMFRFAPFPMKILTVDKDGGLTTRSSQPTLLAAFANTSTYGGGMKIAPHARMDDGQLDICVIGGVDPFKFACLFPTVYFGRHLRIGEVQYFQGAHLRVETERPLDVYADGEYMCRTPAEFSVRPRVMKVILHPSLTSL
jgi:diacylglycerol kinase family enzyme